MFYKDTEAKISSITILRGFLENASDFLPTRLCEGRDTFSLPLGSLSNTSSVIKHTTWLVVSFFASVRLMQSSMSHLYRWIVHIIPKSSLWQVFSVSEAMFKFAIMRRQQAPPPSSSAKNSVLVSSGCFWALVCYINQNVHLLIVFWTRKGHNTKRLSPFVDMSSGKTT